METLEQEAGAVPADQVATGAAVDHACRGCGGRVLASAGGASVRCAECERERRLRGYLRCGALRAGYRVRLKCVRTERPTPESPAAIVATEDAEASEAQPSEVAYVHIDGCGRRFFRCPTLRSSLSTEGCASNWRRAQRVSADELGFS